jgi:protocatechuate 3,4-dioxygenase beta subunit
MNSARLSRRHLLEQSLGSAALVLATPVASSTLAAFAQGRAPESLKPTARNQLGPFFRKGAPEASRLRVAGDAGFPLRVTGRVVNTRGGAVPDARVEIWHADHAGIYDVAGYRYRARLPLGPAQADYSFDTVMPGHYPDRVCQHIHYLVTAPGHQPLVTQLYFATDPVFDGDPARNYMRDPLVQSRELVRPVRLYETPGDIHAEVLFELCLERA